MSQEPPTPPQEPPSGIALFDLDGTLLPWDCQLLFRRHVTRREPWRIVFLPLFLAALPFAAMLGTSRMKRVYHSYLRGITAETLARHSREFAPSAVARMHAPLLDEVARHRDAGHWLILSSASPECYVMEIGRRLGFHLALGTRIGTTRLFPPLENHKGEAKTRRLRALLPSSWFGLDGRLRNSHGYTDSRADLPMLGLCEHVTLVNPSPALSALGKARGWAIINPPLPWKSRTRRALAIVALLFGFGR